MIRANAYPPQACHTTTNASSDSTTPSNYHRRPNTKKKTPKQGFHNINKISPHPCHPIPAAKSPPPPTLKSIAKTAVSIFFLQVCRSIILPELHQPPPFLQPRPQPQRILHFYSSIQQNKRAFCSFFSSIPPVHTNFPRNAAKRHTSQEKKKKEKKSGKKKKIITSYSRFCSQNVYISFVSP